MEAAARPKEPQHHPLRAPGQSDDRREPVPIPAGTGEMSSRRPFSIARHAACHVPSVLVVIIVTLACMASQAAAGGQAATAAEPNADSRPPRVPLREGLMLVSAYRNT